MKIIVENFGKIKKAEVDISGYTIFVGDNNSGKTYLMQLIYGILCELQTMLYIDDFFFNTLPFKVDESNCVQFIGWMNSYLEKNKNRIVKNIFGKDLSIGSISVNFEPLEQSVEMRVVANDNIHNDILKEERFKDANEILCVFHGEDLIPVGDYKVLEEKNISILEGFFTEIVFCALNKTNIDSKCIYLPTSRSGLSLLYRDVIGNMAKEFALESGIGKKGVKRQLGLTTPVFNYMLFLQQYKKSFDRIEQNTDLIKFIENQIVGGQINRDGDDVTYKPINGVEMPLYLASSMVGEMASIMHILTSSEDIKYIFYDEVETSQHPTTQIQLARMLNRLSNKSYRLIVSTHSDTMAAAISNLVTLSFIKGRDEKTTKLGYDKEDLLVEDCIHAYQFEKDEDGRSVVRELQHYGNIGLGFDFSLFNSANKTLFNDYQEIMRDAATK